MNNNILFLPSLFLHVVKIELEFLNALQINDTVNQLAEMVPSHPEDPDSNLICRLYTLCRGIKDDKKYELLNTCMIIFSQQYIKINYREMDLDNIEDYVAAQYQPNSVSTNLRSLFSVFSKNQVMFSLTKDFRQQGTSKLTFLIFFSSILYLILCSFFFFQEGFARGGNAILLSLNLTIRLLVQRQTLLHSIQSFVKSDLALTKTPTKNSLSLIKVARSFIMTIS